MAGAVATYPSMPKPIDTASFAKLPAGTYLLDFTAKWCGPCKVMNPVLDKLADAYKGRVEIVAIDVDDEPALAQRFDVRSMPTCVIMRDGREVGRVVGSRPHAFVAGMLDRALAGDVAIAAP